MQVRLGSKLCCHHPVNVQFMQSTIDNMIRPLLLKTYGKPQIVCSADEVQIFTKLLSQ
jgi:uncharacterized protein (UPF0371 family)